MTVILTITVAILTSVLQVAFFSHLFFPFSHLSAPVIVISYAIFTERPVTAAIWALFSGLTLDLHGLSGFGSHTILLLFMTGALWLVFRRVITNAGLPAAFLLTTVAVTISMAGFFAIDGMRLLFGEPPLMLPVDEGMIRTFAGLIAVNGSAAVGLTWSARALHRRFERNFIRAS